MMNLHRRWRPCWHAGGQRRRRAAPVDNWAAYHALKAHGQKLVEGDLFADIQRATDRGLNKHSTVVSEEEEKKSEEEGEGEGEVNTSDYFTRTVICD